MRKWKVIVLTLCLILVGICSVPGESVQAKSSIYDNIELRQCRTKCTVYLNQKQYYNAYSIYNLTLHNAGSVSQKQWNAAYKKVYESLVWTTSDESILAFVSGYKVGEDGMSEPVFSKTLKGGKWSFSDWYGRKKGTVNVTLSSKLLNQKITCKVTVKDAELTCEDGVFYSGQKYAFAMKGNAAQTSFSSSDEKIATVNSSSGVVTAKKAGTVTISCLADNGKTYTYKMKIQKPGLSYTKLTSYYFTGFQKGSYSTFPLVAKGISVKKWKSSNEKVVKVLKKENIGLLQIRKTGKTTITCVADNGKTYTCKVTIVGGKPWSGLNGGYLPTSATVKKHGYYKDINMIKDYGKVVYFIVDYNQQINYKNGSKKMSMTQAEDNAKQILANRYPDKIIQSYGGGDLLIFKDGSKYARLWVGCFYVE